MKNSTPAVLMYYQDLLSGTDYMTDAEFGQYVRLLMRQNLVGHMSDEYLKRIHMESIYPVVAEKFTRDQDGYLYNERMEMEIERRVNYSESRSKNRNSEKHMSEHMKKHMYKHMETETETVTEKDINNQMSMTAESIISYLNQRTGKRYRANTRQTKAKIQARLNDGYTIDDFKKVIDIKATEWMGTDMEKYLRPETLFGPKFEAYLNQREVRRELSNHEIAMMLDEAERRNNEQDAGWSDAGESVCSIPEHLPWDG